MTFTEFTGNVWLVSLVLVPMLPILLVTTEWTQRTAMVSFAIEPRRLRVILAKLAVAVLLAIAAVVLMFVVATLCTAVGDLLAPDRTSWEIEAEFVFLGAPLTVLVTTVFGFAVACMLLNTPAAIVLFLLSWYASVGILAAIAGSDPRVRGRSAVDHAPDQRADPGRRTSARRRGLGPADREPRTLDRAAARRRPVADRQRRGEVGLPVDRVVPAAR